MEYIKSSLILRLTIFVLLPFLLFGLNYYEKLNTYSMPQEGQFSVDGLKARVNIRHDNQGVPFIEAEFREDAFFAVGFVHARDRLWQMEIFRRIASGHLSEVLGSKFIDRDAWFRTIGLSQAAKASWGTLDKPAQASLTAYAKGVNQWIEQSSTLAPEFQLLGIKPDPWTVYDSLSVMKLLAYNLGGNLRDELSYLVSRKLLTEGQLRTLFPELQEVASESVQAALISGSNKDPGVEGTALLSRIRDDLKLGGRNVGSNAWVVSGKYTTSGQPLLANDPHLGIQIPSLWYTLKVNAADWRVGGQSIPGIPLVVFGRNENIGWGGTNLMADQQDLNVERLNPSDLGQYLVQDRWVEFEVRKEQIRVRTDFPETLNEAVKPVELTIKTTRNGPVVSELLGLPDLVLSLNWPNLGGDASYQGFFKLNFAHSWDEFRKALAVISAPSLNMMYADVKGNIGYQAMGKIQLRQSGQGLLPQAGWLNTDAKFVSFSELPKEYNPERGYIANANNRVVDSSYPYYLSSDWADPARINRIRALLDDFIAKGQPIDRDDLARIQNDNLDLYSQAILPGLRKVHAQTERQKAALDILAQWHGSYDLDSLGASIYHAWYRNLLNRVFADELQLPWAMQRQSTYIDGVFGSLGAQTLLDVLYKDEADWCDDKLTEEKENCKQVMLSALDDGLDELTKLAGSDMNDWRWGTLHTSVYSHIPFSDVNLLDTLFERKISSPGTYNTINATTAEFKANEGYVQNTGPGFRQIIQLSEDMGGFSYVNSTGQSGHLLSPHFDDMIIPFRDGRMFDLANTAAGFNGAHTELTPKQGN